MSSRKLVVTGTVLGLLLTGFSTSNAQGFRLNAAAPKFPLLMSKNVQQELKMTEEQVKKVKAKIDELMPQDGPVRFGGGDGEQKVGFSVVITSPQGGGGGAAAGGGEGIKIPGLPDFKKLDEEVEKLIDQPQRDRLKQIALQQQGLMALEQDKIATELGLDADQRTLLKETFENHHTKIREYFQEQQFQIDQGKMREFMKSHRDKTETDINIILTDKQKEKWAEMIGPKFAFKR